MIIRYLLSFPADAAGKVSAGRVLLVVFRHANATLEVAASVLAWAIGRSRAAWRRDGSQKLRGPREDLLQFLSFGVAHVVVSMAFLPRERVEARPHRTSSGQPANEDRKSTRLHSSH